MKTKRWLVTYRLFRNKGNRAATLGAELTIPPKQFWLGEDWRKDVGDLKASEWDGMYYLMIYEFKE